MNRLRTAKELYPELGIKEHVEFTSAAKVGRTEEVEEALRHLTPLEGITAREHYVSVRKDTAKVLLAYISNLEEALNKLGSAACDMRNIILKNGWAVPEGALTAIQGAFDALTALPKAQAAPSVEYTREECGECGAQIMLVDGLEQCSCPSAISDLDAVSSGKMDTKHDHLNAEMNAPGRVILSEEHFAEFERILEREPQKHPRLVKLLQGASSDTKDDENKNQSGTKSA